MGAQLAGGTADKEKTDLYCAANLLERARALAPKLRERSYATNKAGRIPAETIQDLWDFRLNYLLPPKKFGGPAMRPDEAFAAGFDLGRGDGSAAWVWSVMLIHDLFVSHFPEEFQHEYWARIALSVLQAFCRTASPHPPAAECAFLANGHFAAASTMQIGSSLAYSSAHQAATRRCRISGT
jgi:alkylation response protein AidB-like acyl-CoA dehydrogenase